MLRAAPLEPDRRDIFIEGVSDRLAITYRIYHRPTGLVVAASFSQSERHRMPSFKRITGDLFVDLVELLHKQYKANLVEAPFDAPAA